MSSINLDPSDFAEDATEVYDLEDLEEVGEEMPSSKTKSPKKSPKKPAEPKKKGQKVSTAPSIQDITSGMDGVKIKSKSKCYSFTIYEPYKNHPFVKGDKNLVLVEVFTSPVPQNYIQVGLSRCGMKATFCKATHHFVAGHAHHKVDKLSDDKHYLANSSESIVHQNTSQIICKDYNDGPADDLYWSNPIP